MAALAVQGEKVLVERVPEELLVEDHLLGDLDPGLEDEIGQRLLDDRPGLGMHSGDLRPHPVDDDLGSRLDAVIGDEAGGLGKVSGDADELGR